MIIFIANVDGERGQLTADESWHCAKVLRKKAGDAVHLIDGKGNFYEGTLEVVSEKQCLVKVSKGPIQQTKKITFCTWSSLPPNKLTASNG